MRGLPILVLAGCFGRGPEPTPAPEAEIVFALELGKVFDDGDCQSGRYIGNTAIGATHGYAITHTFQPACSNGGGPGAEIPVFVFEFPKLAGSSRLIDDAAGSTGVGGGPKPRIAAVGSEAVWTFQVQNMATIQVRSKNNTITGTFSSPVRGAASLVVDGTNTYFAGWEPPGGGPVFITEPRFPCCGFGGSPPPPQNGYVFAQLANTQNSVPTQMAGSPPQFFCEQMKECLVGTTDSLFYIEHAGSNAAIAKRAKTTTDTGTQLAVVLGTPSGFAANDARVAWSTSKDFARAGSDPDSCTVYVMQSDGAPGSERVLLVTTSFSCVDVALDGNFVYFVIVTLGNFEDQGDLFLVNRGIGRVAIDTGVVETLALGVSGPQAGPRQIFVDGDDLFVAAPFVVAKIRKSALDGRLDIAP